MTEQFFFSLLLYFLLGSLTGMLSGTLGIGGGVIMVPGLAWLFSTYHFPAEFVMQMAAATSLGVMFFSMLRALIAHRRYYVEFWSIYRRWVASLVVGALLGVILANYMHSQVLGITFGVFVIVLAVKMLIPHNSQSGRYLPGRWGMASSGTIIGVLSGMLGIGGGAMAIPFLVHYNVAMRRAVVISIAVGVTVSMIGGLSAIFVGIHQVGLPSQTIGYIYWPAWLGLVIGSFIFAPIGVALSHRLPVIVLRRILAVVLILMGLHLLIRY